MKKEIVNCLSWYANQMAQATTYDWSGEFRAKYVAETTEKFNEGLAKHIDFSTLTRDEAKELRFKRFDEEYPDLYLFPLYLVPIIPEGFEVMTIGGNTVPWSKGLDNDVRFGCVAYGINIPEDRA